MTIYALSSGPGLAGVAVIRVSGPETKKVLKNITFLPLPEPKFASLRKFKDPETKDLIDEGILLWFLRAIQVKIWLNYMYTAAKQ